MCGTVYSFLFLFLFLFRFCVSFLITIFTFLRSMSIAEFLHSGSCSIWMYPTINSLSFSQKSSFSGLFKNNFTLFTDTVFHSRTSVQMKSINGLSNFVQLFNRIECERKRVDRFALRADETSAEPTGAQTELPAPAHFETDNPFQTAGHYFPFLIYAISLTNFLHQ